MALGLFSPYVHLGCQFQHIAIFNGLALSRGHFLPIDPSSKLAMVWIIDAQENKDHNRKGKYGPLVKM